MSWLQKLVPSGVAGDESKRKSVPEGLWTRCEFCENVLYRAELERTLEVCPKCNAHRTLGAWQRLDAFLDPEDRVQLSGKLEASDPLKFKDSKRYKDRLSTAQKATGYKDALLVMEGRLKGLPLVAAAFEFGFMGGSMGSVVGEEFVRAATVAVEKRIPMVCFSASGGARMQESLFSLMQMAKTAAAIGKLSDNRIPYISVMCNSTMGGVAASLSMLGDINIAEPRALIGFAGPRVIEQTVRQTLPEGFQRSEFLLEHGAIDMIMDRRRMRERIHNLLAIMQHQGPAA